MEELLTRLKVRLPNTELTDNELLEYLSTVNDRLCLRLGAETLPPLFGSVCIDATVKMIRRIYYEGISSEGVANISTSFVDDVLAEYASEIRDWKAVQAESGNSSKVVKFY
jgi:hypothetical protein|uniref:Tail connector protein n=1 Tax=Siphoviridae sp. ctnNB1 TaxID=2825660 RepID=A0A8S5UVD7_9CAUD|nr:MAG TPA: tail connector protein [Siphoviridae sp. ctnNB1]